MKKIWSVLLCLMLLAALAVTVNATEEEPTREDVIVQEARRVYYASRGTAGKKSFAGYCGLMTSHQLYHMGINETIIVNDGNRQYDYYAAREVTSGGYYITAYPASDYTLTEALNAITKSGTQDAYNLLVGFQWTNTQAGGRYGHACVINAIMDGTVYFTESFYTSIAGPEGNVGQCSIERFAELFSGWTSFEGVIDFGTGQYAETCETYPTSMYVRVRFDTTLRSQPCLLGDKESYALREVKAGELLSVSAICKDLDTGIAFYRVEDGEGIGYISAGAASVYQINEGSLSLVDVQIPAYLSPKKSLQVKGDVVARKAEIGKIEVVVTDLEDKIIFSAENEDGGYRQDLAALNKQLKKHNLKKGWYKVQIYGSCACNYVLGTKIQTRYTRQLIHEQFLQVNNAPRNVRFFYQQEEEIPAKDGWVLEDGLWHRYKENTPQTGWLEELGIKYYLDETGAVTTGWKKIDGVKWYFSPTGALVSGWLATKEGMMYLPQSGGQAMGWQTIEEDKYYFDEDKLLVTEGIVNDGQKRYEIQSDGRAVLLKKKK